MTKVAVVTAAGTGIGAAVAREFAERGYAVCTLSRSDGSGDVAHASGGFGMAGSVCDPAAVQQFVDRVDREFGQLDVLVNGAGHGPKGSVVQMTDDEWRDGMEMYFLQVVRFSRLAVPLMTRAGGGSIVNISTSTPNEPNPKYPTSGTFRAALAVFSKLLADEVGPLGIRVNNILPGPVDSWPVAEDIVERIPVRRAGTVGDIARLAAFLAGDESTFITGQSIRADGGLSRSL